MATKERLMTYADNLDDKEGDKLRTEISKIVFSGPDESCDNAVAEQAFERAQLTEQFRHFLATLMVTPTQHGPASDAVFWNR